MSAPASPSKPNLVEELRDYYEQVENIKEDAVELTAPLTADQFNWRPSAKAWSISECLDHLNLANRLDLARVAEEIERGDAAGIKSPGPFRYGVFSRKFVRFTEPPPKLKVRAPKVYRPAPGHTKEKVVPEFVAIHDQLLALIVRANGLDLARIKVATPFRGIKFALGQYFALVTAHDRRHLWQAWQVRRNSNFPL